MNDWAPAAATAVIAICITVYYVAKLKRPSVASEIEKLAELKGKGLLSDQEFEKQKKKLLEG